MSEIFAVQLTAVFTAILGVGAIVTAVLAYLAFRKQSREVSDQAEMLDLQRKQLAEQQETSAKQAEVLELQAKELRESLDERKRAAEEKRRGQADLVTAWFAWAPVTGAINPGSDWGATVRNASGAPIFDVRINFDWIYDQPGGREWIGITYGSLPGPVTIIPPDTTRHFPIPADVRQQDPRCYDEVYAVSITFTDAAGNRWKRNARGALNPLT